MAWRKVSTSTSPADAIFEASSAVTPISFARNCRTGIPWSPSWAITSPWTLLVDATLLKIAPMLPMSVPAIVAASPTSVRTDCRSLPGLMPAATAPAAVEAASSMPNAVPFTDASAFFMMPSTVFVEWPRPVSFACASSRDFKRPKPLVSAVPASAPAARNPPAAAFLKPPDRRDPSVRPCLSPAWSTAPPTSRSISLRSP